MRRWTVFAALILATLIASCTTDDPITIDDIETTTSQPETRELLPDVFSAPISGLSNGDLRLFLAGQVFFRETWTPAGPGESGNDGLGPLFNADSCVACHASSGRRQVPPDGELTSVGLIVRLSIPGVDPITGAPLPEPNYGDQLQDRAIGVTEPEGTIFTNYVTQTGTYRDGTPFELLWPTVNIRNRNHGPLTEGAQLSARIGSQLIGMGLLEAVPDEVLLANADPNDADNDGVSGRPNMVWNPQNEQTELGRFGWKANVVALDQQIVQAFHGDLGITSFLIPKENCAAGQMICAQTQNGGTNEVSDERVEAITHYLRLLAVPPPRTNVDKVAQRGAGLFDDFECSSCHTAELKTGPSTYPELANQTIHPYTDLLLHDLGFDMGDDRPDFEANGREWRTAPLWGLGLVPVESDRGLLHDGRARTLEEAILWHGGEGSRSRSLFMSAALADRQALLAFVDSL